jgi:hypothetical protein
MKSGEKRTLDGGVVQRVEGGNLRRVVPRVGLRGTLALPGGSAPVVAVGYASSGEVGAAVAVTAGGALHLVRETRTESLVGDSTREFAFAPVAEGGAPVPAEAFAALVDEEVRVADVTRSPAHDLHAARLAPAIAAGPTSPAGSRLGAAGSDVRSRVADEAARDLESGPGGPPHAER